MYDNPLLYDLAPKSIFALGNKSLKGEPNQMNALFL